MPLLMPSVDLQSGKVYIFSSKKSQNPNNNKVIYINDMDIAKAVRASCSYPVVFSPCVYKQKKLVDGGIRENVPWKEVKALGADKVLSIMFDDDVEQNCDKNLIEVAGRSLNLLGRELSNYEMEGADYIIRIKSDKVGLLDMSKIDELYQLGYQQTKEYIKKIKIK